MICINGRINAILCWNSWSKFFFFCSVLMRSVLLLCIYYWIWFSETSAIYESINYDETPTVVRRSKSSQRNTRNSLQRQDAIDGNEVKPNTNRDASSFLNNFIPPPPTETPPQRDEYDLNPVQISSETFEKLNSLYNSYEPRRTTFIGNDDTEDAVRLREFNNNYSARSYRGSSKAMCSYVSVNHIHV